MGRELQKKKKRSSIPKIKMKRKSKPVNPMSNPIVAANWNSKETLTQNYRRLGLTSRLNAATGGTERLRPGAESTTSTASRLNIPNAVPKTITPTEARVERDPETGKITRVIHAPSKPNPLNDPLNSDNDDDDDDEQMTDSDDRFEGFDTEETPQHGIIRQLEAMAARVPEKTERKQSEREREWIERLVARHGDDYQRMAWDMKLNPMQQTAADIKKRVGKWRASEGGATAAAE